VEAFTSYADYINEAETRDIKTLKRRLSELKGMSKQITADKQQAETT
jgi:hypothetical protein